MSTPRRKRPGRYHHGDLRQSLIDTALLIIDEDGTSAVTIRALARRLGVSHAAPGYHFQDREALLCEVATQGFRMLADDLEQAVEVTSDAAERLSMAGKAYLRFAADHPSYLRVMFGRGFPEGFVAPEPLRREQHRAYMPVYRAAAALAATESDSVPAKEVAFAAWSLVHGMAIIWLDGAASEDLPNRETFEAAGERILRRAIPSLARAQRRSDG